MIDNLQEMIIQTPRLSVYYEGINRISEGSKLSTIPLLLLAITLSIRTKISKAFSRALLSRGTDGN